MDLNLFVSMGRCQAPISDPTERKPHLICINGRVFILASIGGMLLPWIAGNAFTFLNPQRIKVILAASLLGGAVHFPLVQSHAGTKKDKKYLTFTTNLVYYIHN